MPWDPRTLSILFPHLSMKHFFSIPVVLGTVFLTACSGPVSQQRPAEPTPVAPKAQVTQEPYHAGALQTYSPTAYAGALADGKTVIIDFHADWCDICAKNFPHIRAAFENTSHPNVVGFKANYDTETALENQFGVTMQSTLVKVHGNSPETAEKVSTLGPGPLTQEQVEAFIQS